MNNYDFKNEDTEERYIKGKEKDILYFYHFFSKMKSVQQRKHSTCHNESTAGGKECRKQQAE